MLIFLSAAVSVSAQPPVPGAPAPVPLFSAEVIRSFTPPDNPVTDAKAKLGDMIFDEKRISADNSVACNTCHSPPQRFHHPHRGIPGRRRPDREAQCSLDPERDVL
jgi:cytochrome c peroxidase